MRAETVNSESEGGAAWTILVSIFDADASASGEWKGSGVRFAEGERCGRKYECMRLN